jgi:hypothetical protein
MVFYFDSSSFVGIELVELVITTLDSFLIDLIPSCYSFKPSFLPFNHLVGPSSYLKDLQE